MDLPLSPLPGRLRVWLFKDVENVKQLRDSIIGKTTSTEDENGDKKDEKKKPQTSPSLPLLTFPDASFLDASLVPDLWTLRLAAFAAEAAGKRGRARSRSRHTELVVALSGGKNISAALATFGLSDSARHLLVARFADDDDREEGGDEGNDDDDETSAAFVAAVRGTPVPAAEVEAELARVSDAAAQARAFKIAVGAAAGEEEEGGGGGGAGKNKGSGGGGASKAFSPAGVVEVGPLSDAAACRIALRDC